MKKSLYQVIAGDMINAIDTGQLKPGENVWSIKDMKNRYGVSHLTAMKTLKFLAEQNRIQPQNGGRYRGAVQENNRKGNRIISAFRMLSEYNSYDNFGNRIISGICRGCLQKGFSITALPGVISVSGRNPSETEAQRLAEEIAEEKNCAGVIFDMRLSDELLGKYMLPACSSVPCVLVGRTSKLPINTVSAPSRECAKVAAKLANCSSAKQYAIIQVEGISDQDIFISSFTSTLAKMKVRPDNIYCPQLYSQNGNTAGNQAIFDELLHRINDFNGKTSIVVMNSYVAGKLCSLLLNNDLQLHEDFCLLSYGGFELSYNSLPRIAEIAINAEEIGYIAADIVTGSSKSFQKEHCCSYKIDFNETM